MGQKHLVATVVVAAGLVGSGFLFSQAWSDATPVPPSTTSEPVAIDGVAVHAADKAALEMMCDAGQRDTTANAAYRATVAAHPDLASDIGPDCRITTVAP